MFILAKYLLAVFFITAPFLSKGQNQFNPGREHVLRATKAYNLLIAKKYKESALTYDTLFVLSNGQGTIGDRYNGACAMALTGNVEKAFLYLTEAVIVNKWRNIGLITTDPDLQSLHSDKRWNALIDSVRLNIIKYPSAGL